MAKCRDVMTPNPVCCLATDTVDKAAQFMKNKDIGSLPVVDSYEMKKLTGIVTDRDLTMKIVAEGRDPRSTRVQDAMTHNPMSCRDSDDIQNALDTMAQMQVRRVPVVDNTSAVVGIIAQADVATRVEDPRKTGEVVEEISQPA